VLLSAVLGQTGSLVPWIMVVVSLRRRCCSSASSSRRSDWRSPSRAGRRS